MNRLVAAVLGLALTCCRADPQPRPQEVVTASRVLAAPPVASSAVPRASAVVEEPAAALSAAHRAARRLFAKATVEPDRKKARALFLEAAEALPPGGPALYQAGLLAAHDGDAAEARGLFDRALAALAGSTHRAPSLTVLRGLTEDRGRHGQGRDREGIEGLVAATDGRLVLLWGGRGLAVYSTDGFRTRFEHHASTEAAALSNDGSRVVFATTKRLFSCSLIEAACVRVEPPTQVVGLALSADGETLVARTEDGAAEVRKATTLAVRMTFRSEHRKASAVAASPAGDRVFVGTAEGTVLRLRADTGEVEGERRGHTGAIVALAVDASGRILASADHGLVRVGAPSDAEGEVVPLAKHDHPTGYGHLVSGLVFSPDGEALFVERGDAENDPLFDLWSTASRTVQSRKLAGRHTSYHLAPTRDRVFVTLDTDGASGLLTRLAAFEPRNPGELDFEKDMPGARSWYVSQGPERWVHVPRLAGGLPKPPRIPGAPSGAIEAAGTRAWVGDAAGSCDRPADSYCAGGAVHVGPRAGPFRVVGNLIHYPYNGSVVLAPTPGIALSPRGALVGFRAGVDRAEIWEISGDRPAHVVERAGISGIAFGPDETAFVSALDGTITMVRAGAARTLFAPDGSAIFGLVPLRGGRLIAAGAAGNDYSITYFYSATDGVLRATITTHGKGALATSPAGPGEVLGPIEGQVGCRLGPFVFELDLCRDRLVRPGLLARMLDGEHIDP